jgi:hypothetical protein
MSSNKRTPAAFVFLLALFPLSAQQKPAATSLACPATIEVAESVISTASGWTSPPVKLTHKFERISVYNADSGGKEYDLAPDDQKTQGGKVIETWNLAAYRTMGLFVRCRYHETTAVLQKEVPPKIESCVLRLVMNNN